MKLKTRPLAKELFYLPFVKTVYISSNFIALKRFPIVEWKEVQEEVAQQVLVYLQSGKDILLGEAGKPIGEAITVYTETTPQPHNPPKMRHRQIARSAASNRSGQ